ncbi:MAG: hypothetical protein LBQ43_04270 [Holosporales bacterium]|jgi:hypothetical protein|nr:hypothetical protein [Holosporales bacterium]
MLKKILIGSFCVLGITCINATDASVPEWKVKQQRDEARRIEARRTLHDNTLEEIKKKRVNLKKGDVLRHDRNYIQFDAKIEGLTRKARAIINSGPINADSEWLEHAVECIKHARFLLNYEKELDPTSGVYGNPKFLFVNNLVTELKEKLQAISARSKVSPGVIPPAADFVPAAPVAAPVAIPAVAPAPAGSPVRARFEAERKARRDAVAAEAGIPTPAPSSFEAKVLAPSRFEPEIAPDTAEQRARQEARAAEFREAKRRAMEMEY